MKIKLSKILLLLLSLLLVFGMVACNGDKDDTEDEYPEDNEPLEGLVLIRKNVANFKVVTASGAGSSAIRAAGDFVERLRELGITVDDVITDKDASSVTDCEIIIGTDAKNRPDACSISQNELGEEGYIIKVVGSRVIIAGGTTNLTRDTLKTFIETYLGITDETESRRNVAIAEDLEVFVPTEYDIDKITVAGNDLSSYVIACDKNDAYVYPFVAEGLKDTLHKSAGYWLDIVDTKSVSASARKIIIRTVSDAGEDGFRVTVSGSDLVVECAYPVLLSETFDEFLKTSISSKRGTVAFAKDYSYTKHIATVKYSDFGAKGDGVTNDFFAILAAHEQINKTGQTLIVEEKTYYIGKTWETGKTNSEGVVDCDDGGVPFSAKTIQIKTDVDFGKAKFIIDDTVEGIHVSSRRTKNIFNVARDNPITVYRSAEGYGNQISSLTANPTLAVGATSIPWLADVLTEDKYLVTVKNADHKDYVRFGGNENSGNDRCDVLIVDKDGNIASDTPVIFEFTNITEIQFVPVTDTPITISGGIFKTICCKCAPEHESWVYTQYDAYSRGMSVSRANTTVTGIDHEVLDEPTDKSYPYSGFIAFSSTYNSTLTDSKLSGRQLYYGGKEITTSKVPMGSYDLTMNNSCNTYYKNIIQYRDIKDSKYWGLSASNGCKNLNFDNVVISRIDAHCGLWNLNIENSTIGFAINVIGGGTLNIKNTVKRVGDCFIYLRDDYGATFNGVINIKNCHLNAYKSWNSNNGVFNYESPSYYGTPVVINSGFDATRSFNSTEGVRYYKDWNFGYKCYMPTRVNLDNFTCGSDDKTTKVFPVYVYNNIDDSAFGSSLPHGGYELTDKITYKNMTKPKACQGSSSTYKKIHSIDIVQG